MSKHKHACNVALIARDKDNCLELLSLQNAALHGDLCFKLVHSVLELVVFLGGAGAATPGKFILGMLLLHLLLLFGMMTSLHLATSKPVIRR